MTTAQPVDANNNPTASAAANHTLAATAANKSSTQPQMDNSSSTPTVRVGVLALQGSFREHMALLSQIPGVQVVEVRTKEELASVAGLIIPGGESTTMALVAEQWGLIPELQAFAKAGRPVWGTCAGMIFLAERAEGQKKGGQALLGGLDICVSRNFFGAQINSFETQLPAHSALQQYGPDGKFRAVFIRAPAVIDAGPQVEVLAEYQLRAEEAAAQGGRQSVAVAVRQGPLLATAFHPELTKDLRWHQMFVDMVRQDKQALDAAASAAAAAKQQQQHLEQQQPVKGTRPADLPVYGQAFMSRE